MFSEIWSNVLEEKKAKLHVKSYQRLSPVAWLTGRGKREHNGAATTEAIEKEKDDGIHGNKKFEFSTPGSKVSFYGSLDEAIQKQVSLLILNSQGFLIILKQSFSELRKIGCARSRAQNVLSAAWFCTKFEF